MARKVWYVDENGTKVTPVTAGAVSGSISRVILETGESTPHEFQWKVDGDVVTSDEATEANAEQDAGAVPTRTQATGTQTPGSEVETTDHVYPAGKGPVVADSTNGHTYRIGTTNGALTATQVS